MSAPLRTPMYTVEQYLKIERAADERHEYIDGKIFAMAGESEANGDLSANLVILLGTQLRGTPCRARTKDTKVLSGPTLKTENYSRILFSYPAVVVICGEPKYHDEHRDIVLNPKVIAEVLSPSTEAFDRSAKFRQYEQIPSLRSQPRVSRLRDRSSHRLGIIF